MEGALAGLHEGDLNPIGQVLLKAGDDLHTGSLAELRWNEDGEDDEDDEDEGEGENEDEEDEEDMRMVRG